MPARPENKKAFLYEEDPVTLAPAVEPRPRRRSFKGCVGHLPLPTQKNAREPSCRFNSMSEATTSLDANPLDHVQREPLPQPRAYHASLMLALLGHEPTGVLAGVTIRAKPKIHFRKVPKGEVTQRSAESL